MPAGSTCGATGLGTWQNPFYSRLRRQRHRWEALAD